jgi:protein ERP2
MVLQFFSFLFCVFRTEASEEGDYRMCWDNTFSHFNSKTVFFEIIVESDDDEDDERDPWDIDFENYSVMSPEELYDMKIQDIQVGFSMLISLK